MKNLDLVQIIKDVTDFLKDLIAELKAFVAGFEKKYAFEDEAEG